MAVEEPIADNPALTPQTSEFGVRSPAAKFLTGPEIDGIVSALQGEVGDLLLIVADKTDTVRGVLGRLRAPTWANG